MSKIEIASMIMEFILVFSIMVLGYALVETLIKSWKSGNKFLS
jgi:hypothetical protein